MVTKTNVMEIYEKFISNLLLCITIRQLNKVENNIPSLNNLSLKQYLYKQLEFAFKLNPEKIKGFSRNHISFHPIAILKITEITGDNLIQNGSILI